MGLGISKLRKATAWAESCSSYDNLEERLSINLTIEDLNLAKSVKHPFAYRHPNV